jgi:hypothetical protein
MIGRAATGVGRPPQIGPDAERAREMEERLRIEGLAERLPPESSHRPTWAGVTARLGRKGQVGTSGESCGEPSGVPRWTIGIAAPNDRLAARWGDWHFAGGLARALERRGHVARVRTLEHVDDEGTPASDVRIVLRGLERWPRRPGPAHVLWIISHPELVTDDECHEADLVLVASGPFADHLRTRTSTPVEVLLQATDPVRFRPDAGSSRSGGDVVVVAKTRDARRPIVDDALAAGLRPSIYGTGWRGLVDPDLVVADYVANAQLAGVYASAAVVLNDHWPSMRDWGFVSNRLFDVVACGAPSVSDAVPGIEALFGDAVGQYRDVSELATLVACRRDDRERAQAVVATARHDVLAHHTFHHRVDRLMAILREHGLADRVG